MNNLAVVIALGFILAIGIAYLLLKITRIKRRNAELIGACVFGGFIGFNDVSVISGWPAWAICIGIILVYVMVDTAILNWLNARRE